MTTAQTPLRHAFDTPDVAVTIRPATAADLDAVARLAGRDGDDAPAGPVVVSIADGRLIGALSLSTGQTHHDPFRATPAQRSALRAYGAFAPRPRRRGLLELLGGGTPTRRASLGADA